MCESEEKMATAKRTSDITVALYEWNKLTTRNIAEDEKEYFNGGIEFVWEGKTPEIDEEVLVYNPKTQNIYTDIWIDYGEGIGFENTDEDTVFWMSYPKPPKEDNWEYLKNGGELLFPCKGINRVIVLKHR